MTREEIVRLAKEVGISMVTSHPMIPFSVYPSELIRFANLVAAVEREACADLCDKSDRYRGCYFAAKIRERGNIDKG